MTYFVSKRNCASEPFKVVYREVKSHTSKGYPLSYELKALPEEYATWEEALAAIEMLNARLNSSNGRAGVTSTWP